MVAFVVVRKTLIKKIICAGELEEDKDDEEMKIF